MRTKSFSRLLVILLVVIFLSSLGFGASDIQKLVSDYDVKGIQAIPQLKKPKEGFVRVTKVVDGDTMQVMIDGKRETVRIIGINTPETVDPRRPVECFGKEASDKAKSLLTNQEVLLEEDVTQDSRDKYNRLLRYVTMNNGKDDYGAYMIQNGYAYEYTYETPYEHQTEYKALQKKAEEQKVGLWSESGCK